MESTGPGSNSNMINQKFDDLDFQTYDNTEVGDGKVRR